MSAETETEHSTTISEADDSKPLLPAFPGPLQTTPHPQANEILRQVEFYFSYENLRHDAHLLGLIQQGDGLVSLNEILSWRKMKRFRPMSAVREVLRQSDVVEVVGTKRLRRRHPLEGPIDVVPQINNNRTRIVVPEDKPWLTKNMMKPTGFESYATDGPIRVEEYEMEREEYDPSNSFPHRIEFAITRFCAKRKMHQDTRKIWDKFLHFGGFNSNQRQFNGGLDEKEMKDYTKKEIAELTSYYGISELVMNGLYEDGPDGAVTWFVDFEALAKGFLSSQFMAYFDWYNEKYVATATTVLRSFYNYLLHHDVCPEYRDQLLAAREVCDLADTEFARLKIVDKNMPGDFNVACSTLYGGAFAGLYAKDGEWVLEDDKLGLSDSDAHVIFSAGIAAHGTEEQLNQLQALVEIGKKFEVVSTDEIGIEVTGVSFAEGDARLVYEAPQLQNTVVHPMGKLHCRRWIVPHTGPSDPSEEIMGAMQTETLDFLVEKSTLQHCYPGLKMEVEVKGLDMGIRWIDSVRATYPSFFTWLPNEHMKELKAAKLRTEEQHMKASEEIQHTQNRSETKIEEEKLSGEDVVAVEQ